MKISPVEFKWTPGVEISDKTENERIRNDDEIDIKTTKIIISINNRIMLLMMKKK